MEIDAVRNWTGLDRAGRVSHTHGAESNGFDRTAGTAPHISGNLGAGIEAAVFFTGDGTADAAMILGCLRLFGWLKAEVWLGKIPFSIT